MATTNLTGWIEHHLAGLGAHSNRRTLTTYPRSGGRFGFGDREILNFSSNDYLDLSREIGLNGNISSVVSIALSELGTGSASSRLMTGGFDIHQKFEEAIAAFVGQPAALLFGAGYLANIGVVPALVGRGDTVVADRLVHASLIDGAVLSRARFLRYKHNSIEDLERVLAAVRARPGQAKNRLLILTESVFSMDGDIAPLRQIAELAGRFQAMLVVDEAHALGVFGPGGRGLVAEYGLGDQVTAVTATLSKSFASYGGVVFADHSLRDLLINRSRSQIFNTSLPPLNLVLAQAALELIERNPGWGADLLKTAADAARRLKAAGGSIGSSGSQIVPLIVGKNDRAVKLSAALRDFGIVVAAIRPPTVPQGSARLRISFSRAHDGPAIDYLVKAVSTLVNEKELDE